jgi:hypothetical protein
MIHSSIKSCSKKGTFPDHHAIGKRAWSFLGGCWQVTKFYDPVIRSVATEIVCSKLAEYLSVVFKACKNTCFSACKFCLGNRKTPISPQKFPSNTQQNWIHIYQVQQSLALQKHLFFCLKIH